MTEQALLKNKQVYNSSILQSEHDRSNAEKRSKILNKHDCLIAWWLTDSNQCISIYTVENSKPILNQNVNKWAIVLTSRECLK